VGVVSAPMIEEQGSWALGEALRNVSGVNVQNQSGVADFFVVRGFDSIDGGMVLTDGAVEPEISFYQLYNVERVEVLKGPGGFLYGGSPLAATINMVRKQPEPADFGSAGLSGGSFGTWGGNLDWNLGGRGPGSFRVNGLWRSADGYRDGRESEVRAVNPAFSWRPDETSSLNVSLELLDTEFAPDAGLPILTNLSLPGPGGSRGPRQSVANVPRTRSYQSPFDRSEQETRRAQVDYERELSDRFSLRNKTYYRRLDWLSDGTVFFAAIPGFGPFPAQIVRGLLQLDDTQELFGNQLEGVWRIKTGGVTHEVLAGLEVVRLDDTFTLDVGLLPNVDIFHPVETARRPIFNVPGASEAAEVRNLVVAPYVIDRIGFSPAFQLVLGARWDAIDSQDDVSGVQQDFSQLSPLVGLVYTPSPAVSFYANRALGFAPPSSRLAAAERQPEESEQIELGAKTELLDGKLQATLAVYRMDRENVAITDNTGFTQQNGSQRSQGVELEIAAQPLPRLQTFFSYAYNDAELTRFTEFVVLDPTTFFFLDHSGNAPAFAPEHVANLWVSRKLGKSLTLAGGGRYLSSQFIDEDNVFALDESFTLDASLGWDAGAWRLNLHLKNLTDEETFTRGFGATSVIPAPGFSVFGGVEYRFGL
jgi:TonB-dependent siderophore receptor